MKKSRILFLAGLFGLLLMSCEVDAFTGTDLDAAAISDIQTAVVEAGSSSADPVPVPTLSTATMYTFAGQRLDLTFSNCDIDDATVAAGITFHRILASPSTADGSRVWGTELVPTSTEIFHVAGGEHGVTTIRYLFDFSVAASMSSVIEVRLLPAGLTAQDGLSRLDTDADGIQGETQDDLSIHYVTVSAGLGGSVPGIISGGSAVNPRRGWLFDPSDLSTGTDFTIGAFPAVGSSTWTSTYSRLTATTYTDSTDYSTLFKSLFAVQRFDLSTKTWVAVSINQTSSTYSASNGQLNLVFDSPVVDGVYRYGLVNPGMASSTPSIAGFSQKVTQDVKYNELTYWYDPITVGNLTGWDSPTDGQMAVSTYFDSNDRNGEIHLNFTTNYFNTYSGIDEASISAESVKIWDVSAERYIPWTSFQLITEDPQGTGSIQQDDYLVLKLPATYSRQYNSFEIHLSPALTNTSGTYKMGDWTNVDTVPYLYTILDDDGSTI